MSDHAVAALRRKGDRFFEQDDFERALAHYAEIVRLAPGDHRARFRAARCLTRIGEQERAVTAYHAAAEGLLAKDYLLSAMAACKEALRINPVEKRLKDTLRRTHARAVAAAGRTPVPPPLPPDPLFDESDIWSALTDLNGAALVDRAMTILGRPEDGEEPAGDARPPLPLFAELEREAFVDLVLKMDLREVAEGEILIEQGTPGEAVYVFCAGGARVERRAPGGEVQQLALLGGGSLVGEMALLTDATRSASVVADRPSEVFVLHRRDIEELAKAHASVPQQLVGFCRRRLLQNLVNTSPLFRPFDEAGRLEVLRRFTSKVYAPGQRIVAEGDPGEGLHVILTGEVRVSRQDASGEPVVLATLREGDVFGEISVIRDVPATATVTAARKTAAVMLAADDFAHLLADHEAIREYLRDLTEDRLQRTEATMAGAAEEIGDDDLIVV